MIENFDQIYKVMKDMVLPFITLLIGVYLGQRGNLHLTKRAEFNNLVKEIYFSLKNQIEFNPLSSVTLKADEVALYIPFWRRGFFRANVNEYTKYNNKTSTYNPATGEVLKNDEAIEGQIKAAKKLLPYFKPR